MNFRQSVQSASLAGLCLLSVGGVSWAGETAQVMEMRAKLVGLPVVGFDGPLLGEVVDLMVRNESQIHGLSVRLNPDIAPNGGYISLPWGFVRQQVGRSVIAAPWSAGTIAWANQRGEPVQKMDQSDFDQLDQEKGIPLTVPERPANDGPIKPYR